MERGDDRQTAHELGYEPEPQEIFRLHAPEVIIRRPLLLPPDVRTEAHGVLIHAARNDLVQALEGASADKKNILRIDADETLFGMFSSATRRNSGNGTFQDFQQCLLNPLARHVTRDRCAVAFPCTLADFID